MNHKVLTRGFISPRIMNIPQCFHRINTLVLYYGAICHGSCATNGHFVKLQFCHCLFIRLEVLLKFVNWRCFLDWLYLSAVIFLDLLKNPMPTVEWPIYSCNCGHNLKQTLENASFSSDTLPIFKERVCKTFICICMFEFYIAPHRHFYTS